MYLEIPYKMSLVVTQVEKVVVVNKVVEPEVRVRIATLRRKGMFEFLRTSENKSSVFVRNQRTRKT